MERLNNTKGCILAYKRRVLPQRGLLILSMHTTTRLLRAIWYSGYTYVHPLSILYI